MAMTHNPLKSPVYLSFLTLPSVIFLYYGGSVRGSKKPVLIGPEYASCQKPYFAGKNYFHHSTKKQSGLVAAIHYHTKRPEYIYPCFYNQQKRAQGESTASSRVDGKNQHCVAHSKLQCLQ
jgi:hypothetical protein